MVSKLRKHLVLLIHGLNGSPLELLYTEKKLNEAFMDHSDIVFKTPTCNFGRTGDGIMQGSKRLLNWILVEFSKNLYDRISFIGHSLGGLYSRCVLGLLYDQGIIPHVAQLINFITMATPHLGSRQHVHIPDAIHAFVVRNFIGKTVLELTMTDTTDQANSFIKSLTDDFYTKPLGLAENLLAYSSISGDITVNYLTGNIRRSKYIAAEDATSLPHIELDSMEEVNSTVENVNDEMIEILSKFNWKRFAVIPARPFRAHTDIIVRSEKDDVMYGGKIVDHMIGNFVHRPKDLKMRNLEKGHLVLLFPGSGDDTLLEIEKSIRERNISRMEILSLENVIGKQNRSMIESGKKCLSYLNTYFKSNSFDQISIIGSGYGGLIARYVVGELAQSKAIPKTMHPVNFIGINTPSVNLEIYQDINDIDREKLMDFIPVLAIRMFDNCVLYADINLPKINHTSCLAVNFDCFIEVGGMISQLEHTVPEQIGVDYHFASIDWDRFVLSPDDNGINSVIAQHIQSYIKQ